MGKKSKGKSIPPGAKLLFETSEKHRPVRGTVVGPVIGFSWREVTFFRWELFNTKPGGDWVRVTSPWDPKHLRKLNACLIEVDAFLKSEEKAKKKYEAKYSS